MSYDEYPELWEEAVQSAEDCSECKIRVLEVPKGESKHYEFCREHHWKFYREYMIKRQKGDKGKDDITMKDIAEGLSEKLEKEVSAPSTEYDAEDVEELVKEIVDKMDDNRHGALHSKSQIESLNQIARYDTALVKPVASELVEKVISAERYPGYRSPGANNLQEVLGMILADYPKFKKEIKKLIQTENYNHLVWGIRALHTTAKLNSEVLFEELEAEDLKTSIVKFLTRADPRKQIFSVVEKKIDYTSDDSKQPEKREQDIKLQVIKLMKYISEDRPERALPNVDKIGEFDEASEGHFDSIITLAFVGQEYPDEVEKFRGQVSSYLGQTSQSIDGEKHNLSGAASLFFLMTGFEQNTFSTEQLDHEIRRLVDASKYNMETQIDAIRVIGHIGTKSDIKIIKFFKTEYSPREFKEVVENSVRKIKNRK